MSEPDSPVAADERAIRECEQAVTDILYTAHNAPFSELDKQRDEAFNKLRAALASRAPVQQPAGEPVAWCLKHKDGRLSYPSIRHEMAVVHQKFVAQDRVIQPTIFQMQMQEDPKPYQYVGQQTEIIPLYVSPPQPASAPTGEGELATTKVVPLGCITTQDIDVQRVLDAAKGLKPVLVLGLASDGRLYAHSSSADMAGAVLMCEQFKYRVVSGEYGS